MVSTTTLEPPAYVVRDYPSFRNTKQQWKLLFPQFAATHSYSWLEWGIVGVKLLAPTWEYNTVI